MDVMEQYHLFSRAAAKALNDAGVRPVLEGEEICCTVLVVVHPTSPEKGDPFGGSLNWNVEKQQWEPEAQLLAAQPYHGD